MVLPIPFAILFKCGLVVLSRIAESEVPDYDVKTTPDKNFTSHSLKKWPHIIELQHIFS